MLALVIALFLGGVFSTTISVTPASGLRQSLSTALPGSTLLLAAGVYSGSQNCNLVVNQSIWIRGSGSANTSIACAFASRCLTISGEISITLSGISFRNGEAPATPKNWQSRATSRKSLETRLHLPRRRSSEEGRRRLGVAIYYLIEKTGELKMELQSQPISQKKGKVRTPRQRSSNRLNPEMPEKNSPRAALRKNDYTSESMGGCVLVQGANVKITDVDVRGCRAMFGAGFGITDAQKVEISDSRFSQNVLRIFSTESIGGAGLYISNTTSVSISNCEISGNIIDSRQTLGVDGGGLLVEFSKTVTLCGLLVSKNQIFGRNLNGGGFSMYQNNKISMANATVQENNLTGSRALTGGGGVFDMNSEVRVSGECVFRRNTIFNTDIVRTGTNLGGGLMLSKNNFITLDGNARFSENLITSPGTVGAVGAGLAVVGPFSEFFLLRIGSLNISGSFIFTDNRVVAENIQSGGGVGFYISQTYNVTVSGSMVARNNSCSTSNPPDRTTILSGAGGTFNGNIFLVISGFISTTENRIIAAFAKITGGGLNLQNNDRMIITGEISSVNNSLNADGSCFGGGFAISGSQLTRSVILTGSLSVENNYIFATGNISGAGVYITRTSELTIGPGARVSVIDNGGYVGGESLLNGGGCFVSHITTFNHLGSLSVRGNYLFSDGGAAMMGGGIYLESLFGNFIGATIESNMLMSLGDLTPTVSNSSYSAPEANGPGHCNLLTQISETHGSISDGSISIYSPLIACSWQVTAPNAMAISFGRYALLFSSFSVENGPLCAYDSVSVYDGDSTLSPLIGKYCGSITKGYRCSHGRCPALNQTFYTTSARFFVHIQTDYGGNFDGFRLNFSIVPNFPTTIGAAGVFSTSFVALSAGAGMAIVSSALNISNVSIFKNKIRHPIVAVGAGLAVSSLAYLSVSDSLFVSNFATSRTAGGGGISLFDNAGVVVAVSRTQITDNAAVAYGTCVENQIEDNSVRCPVAMGGGIFVGKSSLEISDTEISNNTVSSAEDTPTYQSVVQGGGVGTTLGSTVAASRIACYKNTLTCGPHISACLRGRGAGIFADDGLLTLTFSDVSNNQIGGPGVGGGIHISGAANVQLTSLNISLNSARQGGAVGIDGESVSIFNFCNLSSNSGDTLGGAVLATASAAGTFRNCLLRQNRASRASTIIAYTDSDSFKFQMENSTVETDDVGTVALLIGSNFFSKNIWNCTQAGSVFDWDTSTEFLSISFSRCEEGSYTLASGSSALAMRQCIACPYGALCLGSDGVSNGLRAIGGFWGSEQPSGAVVFYLCPSSYCCRITETSGCPYNACQGGRVGPLCGQCPPASGLRFFSEACTPDAECDDANWALFVVCVGGFAMVCVMLAITTDSPSSGILPIILFFYQSLGLVKSTSWKHTETTLIPVLTSIFKMSPSESAGGTRGVCLFPSMKAHQRFGVGMLFNAVVLLAFLITFSVLEFFRRVFLARRFRIQHSRFLASFVRFMTIAYTSLVLTPLQLLQCVDLDGVKVWWSVLIRDFFSDCFYIFLLPISFRRDRYQRQKHPLFFLRWHLG